MTVMLIQKAGSAGIHITNLVVRRPVRNTTDLAVLRDHIRRMGGDDTVHQVADLAAFGPVAEDIPPRTALLEVDIERIRDDAVITGMELSKGYIRGDKIHLQRGTTAPPPA